MRTRRISRCLVGVETRRERANFVPEEQRTDALLTRECLLSDPTWTAGYRSGKEWS